MKRYTVILFLLIFSLASAQSKPNLDSIAWEKENPNWEKRIFKDPEFVNKLEISRSDKSISLYESMKKECRIFGYEKPDKHSRKMILLSIWTFDVENNPCKCPLGSYYSTGNIDGVDLRYLRDIKGFVEVVVLKNDQEVGTIYFEKKWVKYVD